MARVRFLADYNFTPAAERRVSIQYRAGHGYTVTRECAAAAIAKAVAVEVEPPVRPVEIVAVAPRRGRVRNRTAK